MDGNKTQWEEYNTIVEHHLTELLSTYPQVMEIWYVTFKPIRYPKI
jgi:hypothetical protein